MRKKLLFVTGPLLAAGTIGCNPANPKKAPEPVVIQKDTIVHSQRDTLILSPQHGYYHQPSGSYVNLYNIAQVAHHTNTDSSFCMIRTDTVLVATNYHLNMQLNHIKHNNGAFDVHVNCALALAPPRDTTTDSAVLFVAQCNNGTNMVFDTVKIHGQEKSFTLHIKNATASNYCIVLWTLYPGTNSTVAFRDIMITVPE